MRINAIKTGREAGEGLPCFFVSTGTMFHRQDYIMSKLYCNQ
jgi:hypothetical protein